MSTTKIYFNNLDTIRFFAATWVYMQHAFKHPIRLLGFKNPYLNKFLSVITSGNFGVSLFFILSGFLITYLLISEQKRTGKVKLGFFYMRRVLRIWPLYFLAILFSFAIYPGLKMILGVYQPLDSNIWYYLSFLSNFDVITLMEQGNFLFSLSQNVMWSVSVEEQFYLFWPLIFLLPKKTWLYLITSTALFSLFFRFMHADNSIVLNFHTFSVLMDLAIGALFAWAITFKPAVKSWFNNTRTIHHVSFILLGFALMYVSNEGFLGFYSEAIERIFISFTFACFIVGQALTTSKSFLNLSNFKFGNLFGKYTYAMYLLHPIVIIAIDVCCRVSGIPHMTNVYISFLIGVIGYFITLFVSWLSYKFFESKFLQLKKHFTV